MRKISVEKITKVIEKLCIEANCFLPQSVEASLRNAFSKERSKLSKEVLGQIVQNIDIAKRKRIALCQDTGIAEFFINIGKDVILQGGDLKEAVNEGVRKGYARGFFRNSIVSDPFERKNTRDNTPALVHVEFVKGKKIEIILLPKGGGSENSSALSMLLPSDGWSGVKKFVIDTVRTKGIRSCPPLVVGVGVGGSFSNVGFLAKRSLLRDIGSLNPDIKYRKMEKELLTDINSLNIGPMGIGGSITALAVHIEHAPCHIACLPVAVSMQCHSSRRKTATI